MKLVPCCLANSPSNKNSKPDILPIVAASEYDFSVPS